MALRALAFLFVLSVVFAAPLDVARGEGFCSEGDSDHKPLHRAPPAWPHVARLMCLEGTVVVEFTVEARGRVRDAFVLDSNQPGVFDRAAIEATERWFYRPRCENGMAVETQQRTALDFEFAPGERDRCLPGARLLKGEALELAGVLGLVYSMLAEWNLQPWREELPDQIRAALVPQFRDELGRVERFHHELIADIMEQAQTKPRLDDREQLRLADLEQNLVDAGIEHRDKAMEFLGSLTAYAAHLQRQLVIANQRHERFMDLAAESNLDPDLLHVLVMPFAGDLSARIAPDSEWARLHELSDGILSLFEDSVGQWEWRNPGFFFDDPVDQEQFQAMFYGFVGLQLQNSKDLEQFLLGFMDYRP